MSLDPGKDAKYLSDLRDVSKISPTDGFVLTWDSATGLWTPEVAGGPGGTVVDFKESVRVATTANITLSAPQTIDGIAVIAGDRVLVKDQTLGEENGIYVVAAGAWTRATDADTSAEVTTGMFCFVSEGTVNGDSGWVLATNDAITLGTTPLVFVQFTGAGQIIAGSGLSKTGNTIDVNVDASSIEINADTLRVKALGITDAMLAGSISTSKLTDGANFVRKDQANTYSGGGLQNFAGMTLDNVAIIISNHATPALSSGVLRMGPGESVEWRKNDNSGNIGLFGGTSPRWIYNNQPSYMEYQSDGPIVADGTEIFNQHHYAPNAIGAQRDWGVIKVVCQTPTNTLEDGEFILQAITAGSLASYISLNTIGSGKLGILRDVRIPNNIGVGWRNFADSADKILKVNTSDILEFDGVVVSLAGHTHVAANITDFDTQVRTSRLDQMATPTVNTSFGNIKITSLADPTADQDAANKRYVDNLSQGVRWKESVRVATTSAQVLATDFENADTIDGVVLATGDRILIKDQAAGAENGIYTVNISGPPTRALDFDENDEVSQSAVFVKEGTANAESGFVLTNDGAIVIGTTALTFTQFTGLGQITAGSALTKTGNTLDVNVDGTTIEVSADALRIKDLGVTYAKIQNVSATDRILGRDTAGAGVIEELTAAQVKTMIAITKADVTDFAHNVLDSTYHSDVLTGSIAQGDLLKGNATPKIAKFAKGTLDQRIRVNSAGTDIEYFDEIASLTYIISNGGSVISTGLKGFLEIPFACTILGWTLLADVSGSIVIDVWKDTYANFPPTVADTIAGTEKPTLSAVQKNQDLTLTTWTTSVAAGDVLRFNVDSASTVTEVTLSIRVRKRD